MAARKRAAIGAPDITHVDTLAPLAGVGGLAGVRVFDVGQGDAVAILGQSAQGPAPVLRLDYGGREDNPFADETAIEQVMPVAADQLVMLTHWDEDHWCVARRGQSAKAAKWLVPRQLTSPRAVKFAAERDDIHCIPETLVSVPQSFTAQNGDQIIWEKIGPFAGAFARSEDCNRTGVAISVVGLGASGPEAILLPGDAPFDHVSHYQALVTAGVRLRAILAFHHGAGTHWTGATEQLLQSWPQAGELDVVFSCARDNSYGHPHREKYEMLLPAAALHETATARLNANEAIDLLF